MPLVSLSLSPRRRARRRLVAGLTAACLTVASLVVQATPAHATVLLTQITDVALPGISQAAVVSPDKSTVYATINNANSLSVIDAATNTVTATIPVGNSPAGVTIAPNGDRVYVNNVNGNSVSVVDIATNTVINTIPVGTSPIRLAASPDGASVFVANTGSNSVSRINTATGTVVATIAVGSFPRSIAFSPDSSKAYVTNRLSNSVSVIDTGTNTVTANIVVGSGPEPIAISPDGAHVYTANVLGNNVSVISTATNTVTANIGVGTNPYDLVAGPDGKHLYVTHTGETNLKVIDLATNAVSTTALGGDARGVAINADGTRLYVTYVQNRVRVFGIGPVSAITGVAPASGPSTGGNPVTITGTGLASVTGITFGGTPASGVSCTATTCTVTAPPGTGTVHVQASFPGGSTATGLADQYTYLANADLAVALTATGVPGLLGGRVDYVVTITNNGPAAVTSATIAASLPPSITGTSSDCTSSGRTVTCTLGTLASGARTTRHFTAPVGLLTIGLPYSVTATRVTSSPVDPNPNNDSATRNCTVLTPLIISCS